MTILINHNAYPAHEHRDRNHSTTESKMYYPFLSKHMSVVPEFEAFSLPHSNIILLKGFLDVLNRNLRDLLSGTDQHVAGFRIVIFNDVA